MVGIKDMNLPNRCSQCPLSYKPDDWCSLYYCKLTDMSVDLFEQTRPEDCPLVYKEE